jgi:hypothetical protein
VGERDLVILDVAGGWVTLAAATPPAVCQNDPNDGMDDINESLNGSTERVRLSAVARPRGPRPRFVRVAVFGVAALGFIGFGPATPRAPLPFSREEGLFAKPSLNAFGSSRSVKFRVSLPGEPVEFPLEVSGTLSLLTYQWIPERDSTPPEAPRPFGGAPIVAPMQPGFYHLVVVRGGERQVLAEPTLAVMVPFAKKKGGLLNGYRIGTYLAEHLRGSHDRPAGFLEVHEADLDLRVSRHLRLGDFVTHDGQTDRWPKYVALNPRLLDKIELVLSRVGGQTRLEAADSVPEVALDVHSGFRTPSYNRGVEHAARDSRHQYGDAADLAIDADGDGRVTAKDGLLVARAVEDIEREYPDLIGGLGVYTNRRFRTPYVHIDARGTRSRWKG